jgi:sialate O-acetylesterase
VVGLLLADIFSNHMVLQRDAEVPIWGHGVPGERIQLTLGDEVKRVRVDAQGCWQMVLNPRGAGGPYTMTVHGEVSGEVRVEDIWFGEVWVCAGQSNMAYTLSHEQWGPEEIAHVNLPQFRQYRCKLPAHLGSPEGMPINSWVPCVGELASDFSAVGYYLGRSLAERLGVPVGIVVMARGDTLCESWMDADLLWQQRQFEPLLQEWERKLAVSPDATRQHLYFPGLFYREVLQPVLPFAIKGVTWYQGESNAFEHRSERTVLERTIEYRTLFPAMIANWRAAWGNEALPFYFVQLPNYREVNKVLHWAELRDAQLHTLLTTDHTGMVVTIDVGDADDLHPKNKRDIGQRLANWALARDYGQDVVASGPIFREMIIRGAQVELAFDGADGGLVTSEGHPLMGFELAGADDGDGTFVAATAVIYGVDRVVVQHPEIAHPIAVRYAWADNPLGNLCNAASGLPASPFQSRGRIVKN